MLNAFVAPMVLRPAVGLVLVSSSLAGCAAEFPAVSAEPRPLICGGAVCFEEGVERVASWGSGRIEILATPPEVDHCSATARAALSDDNHQGEARPTDRITPTERAFVRGIRLVLHGATPGARLPVMASDQGASTSTAHATVHSWRLEAGSDRRLADEEAVSGDATILDVDETTGRIRVRVLARWSSGIHSELVLDIEGPTKCAAEA